MDCPTCDKAFLSDNPKQRFCSIECWYTRPSDVPGRFWAKVDRRGPADCWPWTGATNRDGYGILYRSARPTRFYRAHRLSWEMHNGPIPDGAHVLHRCDNPPCINPHHLYLGDQVQNNHDRDARGRGGGAKRAGERNGRAKLTDDQVAEIRRRVAAGERQTAVAAAYGIRQPQISRIVRGVQRQE